MFCCQHWCGRSNSATSPLCTLTPSSIPSLLLFQRLTHYNFNSQLPGKQTVENHVIKSHQSDTIFILFYNMHLRTVKKFITVQWTLFMRKAFFKILFKDNPLCFLFHLHITGTNDTQRFQHSQALAIFIFLINKLMR